MIPNTLEDEDIEVVSEEKVINKDFEKSDTEIETINRKIKNSSRI